MSSAIIECHVCNGILATSAKACQKCGAANNYINPKIEEFIRQSPKFATGPFNYQYVGTRLWGETKNFQEKMKPVATVLGVASLLMFFLSTSISLILLFATVILASVAPHMNGEGKSFEVDFSTGSAVWKSSDDVYWAEIKKFFLENNV